MGVVSPIGIGVDQFWQAASSGQSGSRIIEELKNKADRPRIGCDIQNFDANEFMDRRTARRSSRFIQFALAASQMALEQASYEVQDPHRVGVYIGTGAGGFDALDNEYTEYFERGVKGISPFAVTNTIPNMAAGNIAIRWGLKGPCVAPVAACAAGLYAISDAFFAIKHGRINAALAGGSESTMTSFVYGGYESMRAVSSRYDKPEAASRPFDANRDGFVMGEGSGILFLESMQSARERGAAILAELVACHTTCDAAHITAPDQTGDTISRTMGDTIKVAGLEPKDIDLVHAHGTSTPINDRVESKAIARVFNEKGADVPVTALKSMIGHTLGASGSIALAASVQSLNTGDLPPTINTTERDEECGPINLVTEPQNNPELRHVMINAFGFGGHNGCIIVRKAES